MEETISTLDYAFRAKNIRNKPQINSMSKHKLLTDFTAEIEKLKGELIATRHRNGVYMTVNAWEQMTMENDSRRIVNEEQRAKIESMESNLRHKVQELFSLTSNFNNLKKDNEKTQAALEDTNDVLEKTEIVLKNTRALLEEEEMLRKAHEDTENRLYDIGTGLLSTLDRTVEDVDGLHAKLDRKADLDSANMRTWQTSTEEISSVTKEVDRRVEAFQVQHSKLLENVTEKINHFVSSELSQVQSTQSGLSNFSCLIDKAEHDVKAQTCSAHDQMNNILEEIKDLREEVKRKVGEGLNGLSAAAARISKDVIGEFTELHEQLHGSYSTLGKDFKSLFEEMVRHLNEQKTEINRLRLAVQEANLQTVEANRRASSSLALAAEEEHTSAEAERDLLLSQFKALFEESRQRQFGRLKGRMESIRADISSSGDVLEQATTLHDRQTDEWVFKSEQFAKDVAASRDELRTKMQNDWELFDQRNVSIQKTTESVHEETVRIVDTQMNNMDKQMEALDDFVAKARSQNGQYRDAHLSSLDNMASNVRKSYSSIFDHMEGFGSRVGQLQQEAAQQHHSLSEATAPLSEEIRKPLTELRDNVHSRPLQEYIATGVTPQKRQYEYPTSLPRTEAHDNLVSGLRTSRDLTLLPFNGEDRLPGASPSRGFVYNDAGNEVGAQRPTATITPSNTGLREVDANVAAKQLVSSPGDKAPTRQSTSSVAGKSLDTNSVPNGEDPDQPPAKRFRSNVTPSERKLSKNMLTKRMAGMMEGRENVPPLDSLFEM
jgi:kinesin family protein 11